MTQEENKRLVERFPFLLPKNRWTGEPVEDYDYSYTELDSMPEGWRIAFGEQMCEEIQCELDKLNPEEAKNFHIVQIKEKYGFLHFYVSSYNKQINDIIEKYAEMSKRICYNCGAPATRISTVWICPWCDECAKDIHGTVSIEEWENDD